MVIIYVLRYQDIALCITVTRWAYFSLERCLDEGAALLCVLWEKYEEGVASWSLRIWISPVRYYWENKRASTHSEFPLRFFILNTLKCYFRTVGYGFNVLSRCRSFAPGWLGPEVLGIQDNIRKAVPQGWLLRWLCSSSPPCGISIQGLDQHCSCKRQVFGHVQGDYTSYSERILPSPRKLFVIVSFIVQSSSAFSVLSLETDSADPFSLPAHSGGNSSRTKIRYQADIMLILYIIIIILVFSLTHTQILLLASLPPVYHRIKESWFELGRIWDSSELT